MVHSIVLAVLALWGCGAEPPPEPPVANDWALLYWLPYDNDLAPVAPQVIDALAAAAVGPGPGRVAVRAQVDLPGDGGMVRMAIAPDGRRTIERVEGREGSSSGAELDAFLQDAAHALDARRTMIAILGHSGPGGRLAPDDTPGPRTWIRTDEVAAAIEHYGERARSPVDLVFLQTCAGARLDALWELRRASRWLLAAQAPLGAPNDYYAGTLGALRQAPTMDGAELAGVIAAAERPDMFLVLSLLDPAAAEGLPHAVGAAADATAGPLSSAALAGAIAAPNGEALVDAVALARALETRQAERPEPFRALRDLLAHELVAWRVWSPAPDDALARSLPDDPDLGGLWVRVANPDEPDGLEADTRIRELSTLEPTDIGAAVAGTQHHRNSGLATGPASL